MTTYKVNPFIGLENGLNPINDNRIGKSLDLKLTTVDGIVKQLAEDFLFTTNILDGITFFKGQVYRVQMPNMSFSSPTIHTNIMKELSSDNFLILKVRVPEIHSFLPIPSSFSENAIDSKIIDLYPDFILDLSNNNNPVSVGDIVEVTFSNLKDYSDGKIVNKVGTVSNGQGSIVPVGAVIAALEEIYNSFLEKIGIKQLDGQTVPLTNQNAGQEISNQDAYENGRNLGKINLKTIQNSPLKKINSSFADSFLAMKEKAKRDGINLIINEGFRTMPQQQAIYNERYTNGVLNEIGKIKGPSAKPGYSKHQNGIAIDINTGGFDTAIYSWLDRNAASYGFTNTGKRFNPPESWHWEFNNKSPMVAYENDARTIQDVKNDQKV